MIPQVLEGTGRVNRRACQLTHEIMMWVVLGLEPVLRVIKYTLDDPHRAGHGEEHTLLLSILAPQAAPALEVISGYHERWEHELTYDEQKTHQDPPRVTKPTPAAIASTPGSSNKNSENGRRNVPNTATARR